MCDTTDKQKRFCDEYLVDLNGTQAAIRTGYNRKTAKQTANRLLTKIDLKNYIKERMKEKESTLIASQDEVLKYLTSVVRGQSKSSVVVVESTGDFQTEAREMQKSPDEKERLKAAELLGKCYGIFSDRVDANVELSPVVIKDDM